MTRFAYPFVLLMLLVLPALWWLWLRPSRRAVIRFSGLSELRAAGGVASRRARLALPVLRTAALACLIVAAARPQRADESSRVFAEGIAIQMVLDTSGSMWDQDLSPPGRSMSRLDVVKDVARRFIAGDDGASGRKDDLIGLIRFARYADSVCPLTLDHGAVLETLASFRYIGEDLDKEFQRAMADRDMRRAQQIAERISALRLEDDGTAIGDALALAVERLSDLKRTAGGGEQLAIKSRVIILLTDGENNTSGLLAGPGEDPRTITREQLDKLLTQAAEAAAANGIKVYTILAGTGEAEGFRRPDGAVVITGRKPIRDAQLRRVADISGGRYFTARDAGALRKVYDEIDRLERTRTEERRFVRWGELSRPWLLTALACVALQTLLEATRMRKIP